MPFADLDMIWLTRYPLAATIILFLSLYLAVLANDPKRLLVSNKNRKQRNGRTGYAFVVLLSSLCIPG